MGSFYKGFPWKFFFTGKSFVKFFPILKLEIEFHSHKKVVSPKLKNCAHLFIVNCKYAKFQQNQRTFLRQGGREVGRQVAHKHGTGVVVRMRLEWALRKGSLRALNLSHFPNLKLNFIPTKKSFHHNLKLRTCILNYN